MIQKKVASPYFVVFSDDIEGAKQLLNDIYDVEMNYVDPLGEDGDIESLHLMSICKHHIIANSSFSWWGAWLSEDEGMTIAPERWLQDAKCYGIIPDKWIRISNNGS